MLRHLLWAAPRLRWLRTKRWCRGWRWRRRWRVKPMLHLTPLALALGAWALGSA